MGELPWNLCTTDSPMGIAGRASDAKKIRDEGGVQLHICPATGNVPTRMTESSWRTLCAATQQRSQERECIDKNQAQLMRMTRRLNVCSWCKGEILPRGLEFITKEELVAMTSQKREEEMAKQSKLGVCENCGEKSALTSSYGKRVCTTCLKIRSSVQNHVDKIAISARSLGKGEALLSALVPDGGGLAIKVTADLLQVISGLVGYTGEDPDELVAAVRTATALGAHQLTSEAEAGALRTIAGIVGYEGTDGEQLVEAVRKRALTCASCEAEDVLHEIREIVGYTPEQGDKGLADAVRAFEDAGRVDCAECEAANALIEIAELVGKQGAGPGQVAEAVRALLNEPWPPSGSDQHRVDLLRACGLELDDAVNASSRKDWSWAAAAAVQEIGILTDRRDYLLALLTMERADNARLREQAYGPEGENDTRLRDELARAGAEVEGLRGDLDRSTKVIEELRTVHREGEAMMTKYRETLRVLRGRLGLGHLDEDEDAMGRMLEAVASMTHAVSRHQELATSAKQQRDKIGLVLTDIRAALEASESDEQTVDVAHRRMAVIKTLDRLYNAAEDRANLLQDDLARRDAIIARLRDQVAATDESLAEQELWKPEPAPTVPASTWADESLLADFGRRVLRGEVAVQFLGVRP